MRSPNISFISSEATFCIQITLGYWEAYWRDDSLKVRSFVSHKVNITSSHIYERMRDVARNVFFFCINKLIKIKVFFCVNIETFFYYFTPKYWKFSINTFIKLYK